MGSNSKIRFEASCHHRQGPALQFSRGLSARREGTPDRENILEPIALRGGIRRTIEWVQTCYWEDLKMSMRRWKTLREPVELYKAYFDYVSVTGSIAEGEGGSRWNRNRLSVLEMQICAAWSFAVCREQNISLCYKMNNSAPDMTKVCSAEL